jgi:predicted nucleotidyltransferase component of viral defense system
MIKVHPEILDEKRLAIFRKLGKIDKSTYLIGGTAIALQLKHRKSVDFDLAAKTVINKSLLTKINGVFNRHKITVSIDRPSELTIFLDSDIKITFLHYPYENLHPLVDTSDLNLASIEDLASTKVQTIGRRGEWKDYVDIYFLLTKAGLKIEKVIEEAKKKIRRRVFRKAFLGTAGLLGRHKRF